MDRFPVAGEDAALGSVGADAEGGGLREKQFVELGFVFGLAEDGDEHAGTVFFHLHWRGEDVESAGGEGFFEEVAVDLWVHVVEIGFEDADGFGFGCGFFGCFADHEAEDVGLAFEIGGARAVADGVYGHWRLRAEVRAECGDDCGAGGRDQFFLDAVRIGGLAEE